MQMEHDVEACRWCRGDGKDHGTLGMPQVRACPRCAGSGRVYVTRQIFAPAKSAFPPSMAVTASTTGRRRVYKGPAPMAGAAAVRQQQELTEALQKPRRLRPRTKHARRHAA